MAAALSESPDDAAGGLRTALRSPGSRRPRTNSAREFLIVRVSIIAAVCYQVLTPSLLLPWFFDFFTRGGYLSGVAGLSYD